MPGTEILWGRRVVSGGFYCIGTVLAIIAIAMVWFFGETLGITPVERNLYGGAHAAIHVFGILVALSIGMFVIDKSKGYAGLAIVIVLLVGGFGMSNITGFAARNRISVADASSENSKRTMRQYEATKADWEQRRNWNEGMSMAFDKTGYERAQFKRTAADYNKKLAELKMPVVSASNVHADAQANTWSGALGWSERAVQFTTIGWLAFLMFCGEVLSFIFGVRLWAGSRLAGSAAANHKNSGGSSGGSPGSGGSEPKKPTLVHPGPKPEPAKVRAEPSKQRSVFYVPASGAPERLSAFDRAYEAYHANPNLPTRELAKRSGTSQSTAQRVKVKQLGKISSIVRKYGNGRGYQTPAYN